MVQYDSDRRPTINEVVSRFDAIHNKLWGLKLRSRAKHRHDRFNPFSSVSSAARAIRGTKGGVTAVIQLESDDESFDQADAQTSAETKSDHSALYAEYSSHRKRSKKWLREVALAIGQGIGVYAEKETVSVWTAGPKSMTFENLQNMERMNNMDRSLPQKGAATPRQTRYPSTSTLRPEQRTQSVLHLFI